MTLTAIPAAGAIVRGGVFAALMNERMPVSVRKSADQALATASTVLQNVTGLVLPVAAGAVYDGEVDVAAVCSSGSTEDVKYGFTFPSGAVLDFFPIGPATSVTAGSGDGEFTARIAASSGSTTTSHGVVASSVSTNTVIRFRLTMGSTAGNLQLQAAQLNSGANTITIRVGSKMTMCQVG